MSPITERLENAVKKKLIPIDVEERYRDLLNEMYPKVKIGYSTFLPSEIVEKLAPTDFRCGVVDFSGYDEGVIEICGDYYDLEEVDRLNNTLDEDEIREQIEKEMEEAKK